MKNFKREGKLLIEKNGLWIILALVLALIVSFFIAKEKIDMFSTIYARGLVSIEAAAEGKPYSYQNYSGQSFIEDEEYLLILKEKFPEKLPRNLYDEYDELFNKANKTLMNMSHKDKDVIKMYDAVNEYNALRHLGDAYVGYGPSVNGLRSGKIVLGTQLLSLVYSGLIFAGILGFLFTSVEHFTSYSDFTRMVPWSKTKTYLYKILVGLIITSLAYLIIIGLGALIWKNSYLSNLLVTKGIVRDIALGLLRTAMFYIVVVALGMVSGNIFGHIGMMIIGLGGPWLLTTDYRVIRGMLGLGLSSSDPLFVFEKKIGDTIFHPLYQPIRGLDYYNEKMLLGFGIFTLIVFLLGLYWAKTAKAERSGMLVLKRGVSNFAFFMAVVTTISAIGMITIKSFHVSTLAYIVIHGILAYILYRVYKALFSIKIGV